MIELKQLYLEAVSEVNLANIGFTKAAIRQWRDLDSASKREIAKYLANDLAPQKVSNVSNIGSDSLSKKTIPAQDATQQNIPDEPARFYRIGSGNRGFRVIIKARTSLPNYTVTHVFPLHNNEYSRALGIPSKGIPSQIATASGRGERFDPYDWTPEDDKDHWTNFIPGYGGRGESSKVGKKKKKKKLSPEEEMKRKKAAALRDLRRRTQAHDTRTPQQRQLDKEKARRAAIARASSGY